MSTLSTVSTVVARCYLHLRWYFYCTGLCATYCTGVCTKDMTLVVCAPDMAAAPKLSHFRTFVCRPTNNRATTRPNIRLILHRFGQTDNSSHYIGSLLLTCAGARNIIYTNKLTRKGLNIFQSNFEYPVIFWSNSEYSVTWPVTRAWQT